MASEHDIALSMVRLWGRAATSLAKKYALGYVSRNNCIEAARWLAVEYIVSEWDQVRVRAEWEQSERYPLLRVDS